MTKLNLLAAVCFVAVGIGCGGSGDLAQTALPTGISSLNLGDTFDTEGKYVHVFSGKDGELSYVYNDGGSSGPINVSIDADGRITRLTWEQPVGDEQRMQEVMREAEQRFGQFLKNRQSSEESTVMFFEDDATAYSLTFAGNSVILTSELLGKR